LLQLNFQKLRKKRFFLFSDSLSDIRHPKNEQKDLVWKLSDIRQSERYVLDKVIKFKQFHKMARSTENILFSDLNGKDWIEKNLPSIWAVLCADSGILSGVVVLKEEQDDSFYESASFGYGEDGFYYSFMARGSEVWNRVMDSNSPIELTSGTYDFFHENCSVLLLRIGDRTNPFGFLLVEFEGSDSQFLQTILFLFGEKITKEFSLSKDALKTPARGIDESQTQSNSLNFFREQVPNLKNGVQKFRKERVLSILGPKGSGKKTVAKWIHSEVAETYPILIIESFPENFGKLEKSLQAWGNEIGSGSLVFPKIRDLNLGQKQILWSWFSGSEFKGRVVFTDENGTAKESLPDFERLLQKNPIYLPGLNLLSREVLSKQIELLFSELKESQNRRSLSLSVEAKEFLLENQYQEHFSELKNAILSAILVCRGTEIQKGELGFGNSKMDLEVPELEDLDLRRGIQALERQKILLAMRIFSNNQIRMAKALGISRGSLQYKMKQLGLI